MSHERLTRQELSWLLAQEARSAAEFLRKGVGDRSSLAPAGPALTITSTDDVNSTLDALDEAMRTLASLNTGNVPTSRRGRIDLASLLWELAPSDRVSIELDGGMEVFGDEAELRRLLQVLLSLGVAKTSAVTEGTVSAATIRREGRWVRVAVVLGPDASVAAGGTELAWLHRMAVRYGGKLSLEGGQVTCFLPADVAVEKQELEELRQELTAAQEQGEAYARELATMFAQRHSLIPHEPAPMSSLRFNDGRFALLTRFARTLAKPLARELAALTDNLLSLGQSHEERRQPLQRLQWLQEQAGLLSRFGALSTEGAAERVDIGELVRQTLHEPLARAQQLGVVIDQQLTVSDAIMVLHRTPVEGLLRCLVDHAVEVTPQHGSVVVRAALEGTTLHLSVDDSRQSLPLPSHTGGFGSLELEGTTGYTGDVRVFLAEAIARHLGGTLTLSEAPNNGTRVEALLPVRV